MTFALPDTEFGTRATRHLTDDVVAWLTLVDASGTPQPAPVWFLWDGSLLGLAALGRRFAQAL
jgi:hypothetical protein